MRNIRQQALTMLHSAFVDEINSQPNQIHRSDGLRYGEGPRWISGIVHSEPELQGETVTGFRSSVDLGVEYLHPTNTSKLTWAPRGVGDQVFGELSKQFDPQLVQNVSNELVRSLLNRQIEELDYFIRTDTRINSETPRYSLARREHEMLRASLESLINRTIEIQE